MNLIQLVPYGSLEDLRKALSLYQSSLCRPGLPHLADDVRWGSLWWRPHLQLHIKHNNIYSHLS